MPLDIETNRPKGFTRSSNSSQKVSHFLGVEASGHGCCDMICFQSKMYIFLFYILYLL